MSQFRSINSLRADELFGAVTQVLRAEEAGLPFPFCGRRTLTEREVTLATVRAETAARTKAKAKAKSEASAKVEDGRGTPEYGKEEAKRRSS